MPSNEIASCFDGPPFRLAIWSVRPGHGVHGRCRAAQRAVLGCDAPARQPVSASTGRDGPARARLQGRAGHGRPHAPAAGQLRARAGHPAGGRRDRSERAGRSSSSIRAPATAPASAASRPTARSASPSRPAIPAISSAFCPIRCRARPSRTSRRAEAVFLEKVIALHPAGRRQAVRDRQLPGRLGGHDARRRSGPSCSARSSSPARRCPTGRACTARTRCATAAACSAAAGSPRSPAISATASSTAPGWCRTSRTRIPPTRCGASSTISIPRSTPKRRAISASSAGGAGTSISTPRRSSSSSTSCSSATSSPPARSRRPTAPPIDLRNIRSPIVVFCSKGDNITPPQQALDWILDLYENVDEIRSYGQTIVYTIHETVGHLGIFVSGGVAKKQHSEFSSNIDLIDTLPPGLYEAVFEAKTEDTASPDLVTGNWVMRCEERTLDDIRALGGNDAADERRFATAARVSEINLALYRTFMQPLVRAVVGAPLAEWMRKMHPLRLQYEIFSNANPMMAPVATLAEQVRANRTAGCRRQSVRRHAGDRIPPDRRRARRVAASSPRRWPSGRSSRSTARRRSRPRSASTLPGRSRCGGRRRARCTANSWRSGSPSSKRRSRPAGCARPSSAACSMRAWRGARLTSAVSRRCAAFARRKLDLTLADFKALVREQFNMLLHRSGCCARGHSVDACRPMRRRARRRST